MKKLRHKIIGIGLLELMLSLSIIAIIILLATRYFMVTAASQKTNETAEIVTNIAAAGEKWLVTHNNYDSLTLTELQNRNYFPKNVNANPWGGNITVTGDGTTAIIILEGIPHDNCLSLAQKMLPTTCEPTTYKAEDFCGTTAPGKSYNYVIQINQQKTCFDKATQ